MENELNNEYCHNMKGIKKYQFEKLLTTLVGEGILIIHDHYSDDGKNTPLSRHYKVNYGALKV